MVVAGGVPSCSDSCAGADEAGTGAELYSASEQQEVPADAVTASLGCGNPLAVAELRDGEIVLDLGSGGGIDVLLSARRVGPAGKAYGLDMTEEMLSLARANAAEAGAKNVEFLAGHIEAIPLRDNSVDVIISNCVRALTLADLPAPRFQLIREDCHPVVRQGLFERQPSDARGVGFVGDRDEDIRSVQREPLPAHTAWTQHEKPPFWRSVQADRRDDRLLQPERRAVGLNLMADRGAGIDEVRARPGEDLPVGKQNGRRAPVGAIRKPSLDEVPARGYRCVQRLRVHAMNLSVSGLRRPPRKRVPQCQS